MTHCDTAAGETATDDDSASRAAHQAAEVPHENPARRLRLTRAIAFGCLPITAMLIAAAIGYFKFEDSSLRGADKWRVESVRAAKDGAAAILSYRPDSVDNDLSAAENRLTGSFKDSYMSLARDVVIPAAKQRQISASASVPAAASVSATDNEAVVIVFVNQTTVSGTQAPIGTASTVRVTLQRSGRDWLISGFDPI